MRLRQETHFGDRVVRCFPERPHSLYEIFVDAVTRNGHGEALACGAERLTWKQLEERVARVSAGLARRGVGRGDRVALLLCNRIELVVTLFAAVRLGAIVVPLNIREQKPELAYVLGHCGANLIVHEPELAERLPALQQRISVSDFSSLVEDGDVESGRTVASGEPGELWINGPMVVPGYWNDAAATAREFTGGFWHSGDIGSVDAQGFFYVFDRKKDMINRGGYKIYTAEVESALLEYPGVLEAAVVAVPCPVLGERAHAFVTLRDPAGSVTQEALRDFCGERLSDYKVPEAFTFRTEPLPRNANGKVLKRALREELQL